MNKIAFVFLEVLSISSVLISCQVDDSIIRSTPSDVYRADPMKIAAKQALDFVDDVELFTRSVPNAISSVYPWLSSDIYPSTRESNIINEIPDTMLYIVNFANDRGFALVSSDTLMGVVAYVEEGNLTPETNIENTGLRFFLDGLPNAPIDTVMKPVEDPVTPSPFGPLGTWKTKRLTRPLLTTKWDANDTEFTKYCSNSSVYGPIAVGQIVASHRYPSYFKGHQYNWNMILTGFKPDNQQGKNMAARLISDIEPSINAQHDVFAIKNDMPASVQLAFNELGYNYDYASYDYDSCMVSLEAGCPILMMGYSTYNSRIHYWVIDGGYMRVLCDESTLNGTPVCFVYARKKLVHCNWGFGGSFNGYYISGAFNMGNRYSLSSQDTEPSSPTSYTFNNYTKAYYNIRPKNN